MTSWFRDIPFAVVLCVLMGLVAFGKNSAWAQDASFRAQRMNEAPTIDGQLDEAAWQNVRSVSGFRQVEPNNGEAAGLGTTVWLGFDDRNLYVAAQMTDTSGYSGIRVPDLRRDFEWDDNDLFALILDPFDDARSAISFQVTPMGTLRDLLVANGNQFNSEWDAVWKARTSIQAEGWSVEIEIPWATLRYPENANLSWGINFVRKIRRSNEIHAWQPYPRALTPYFMDYAGKVEGLTPPPPTRNIRVQPYLSINQNSVGDATDTTPDVGGELKWAITSNTVLDFTVNTDFAQADADRQVINLSRFSVFFPERRAFFLENAELFSLGSSFAVVPFFSRRIGLDNSGQPLTLDGGARFVSRTAKRSVGGMMLRQQGNALTEDAWFGVGRYLQNVGTRGRLGSLVTLRHDAAPDGQSAITNTTVTVDGYIQPTPSLAADWFVSQSITDGAPGDGQAAYAWIRNRADWGYVGHIQSVISEDYNPSVGFLGRQNLIVSSPALWFDVRPSWLPQTVRRLQPSFTAFVYHEYNTRRFQEGSITFRPVYIEFQDGAELLLYVESNWQRLNEVEASGFRPLGLSLEASEYQFTQVGLHGITDLSRAYAGSFNVSSGPYFDGRFTSVEAFLQVAPSPQLAFRFDYTYNRITSLGEANADASSHLIAPELRLALNPRMQVNAFYQYNTFAEQGAWNVRFSWEFSPLSYLYLVFNDSRYFVDDGLRRQSPERFATQQQAIFKVSYLRQL